MRECSRRERKGTIDREAVLDVSPVRRRRRREASVESSGQGLRVKRRLGRAPSRCLYIVARDRGGMLLGHLLDGSKWRHVALFLCHCAH